MSSKGWATALVLAACSAHNPAYEVTGGDTAHEGDPTGERTSLSADVTGEEPTSTQSGAEGNGGTTVDDGPLEPPECMADLYGITLAGQIFLLDVDIPAAFEMASMPELTSWALATDPDPTSGLLYISPANPQMDWNLVRVVDPTTFVLLPATLTNPYEPPSVITRAGFDEDGALWVGTHMAGGFYRLPLAGGSSEPHVIADVGLGGDLMFIEPGIALVSGHGGLLHLVDFVMGTATHVPIAGLEGEPDFSGIAHDRVGQVWLSTLAGDLLRIEEHAEGWILEETVFLELEISDLAPIVVLPAGCG